VELAIYIKKLLYNHDILVIPGLGGLITQYKPAEINANDHSIAPPSKYLAFDKNLTDNDGLLANYISSQKGISKEEAGVFILTEVESILKRLDDQETILFEGIGYFSKENDTIRFEREPEANFLTDSFGLSNIDYKPVEYNLTPKKNPEAISSGLERGYSVFWIPLAIIGVIIVVLMVYLNYPDIAAKFKHQNVKTPVAVAPVKAKNDTLATAKKTEAVPKDTAKPSDLEKFFDNATDKKKALALESDPKAGKPQIDVTYYLIAGSFKTFDRAKILTKALTKEGYKPEIIQFEQDKYRVSLGEFKDKAQAQAEFDKITAARGADYVWILKK
jgi:nucleoid DNA-binding protein